MEWKLVNPGQIDKHDAADHDSDLTAARRPEELALRHSADGV
jgi:hypothetical protein